MRSEDLQYFENAEFKESLAQYEAALAEGGPIYMDADDLTDIAEYYMVNEREEDAVNCINLAIELHPDAIDPQVFMARRQMFHNNIDEARRIASGITDQHDREVQFLWAEIDIKEGRQREASQRLMRYYRSLDEDRDLFLYDAAGVFMDYDEWEIATLWARQLKEEFPDFDRTDILLSDIMVSCGKCQEAVPLLDKILSRDPFNMEAWNLMAEAQSGQEHYAEALEAIEYLLAIDEHNLQGQLIRANSLFHLNRMKEAHEQYSKYLEQRPGEIAVLYFDSVALTNMERYLEAIERLYIALELSTDDTPELPHILIQSSYLMSKLGKPDQALSTLDEAYSIAEKPYDTDYYMLKAHICMENGRNEQVQPLFDKAMNLSEDKNSTRLIMGIEYAECEQYAKAVEIFEALMHDSILMPDKDERCLPYLAYCTYFLPGHPRHQEYLNRAKQCNPTLTQYLFEPINQ